MGDRAISGPFINVPNAPKPSLLHSLANILWSWISSPNSLSTHQDTGRNSISIVCVSDTHNSRPCLPDGDLLLHAGDLSQYGTFKEIQDQLNWLDSQPHKHKFVIAGNHDLILDDSFVQNHSDRELDKPGKSKRDLNWGNLIYLKDNSRTIVCDGQTLTIYGSPWTPRCGSFAFQYDPDDDIWKDSLPQNVDILLTHGPPATHLDEGKGCWSLLGELWRVRPRMVVFGHIHGGRGHEFVQFNESQFYYENVVMRKRAWINLFMLFIHWLWGVLGRFFLLRQHQGQSATHLVNAAVAGKRNLVPDQGSIVVDL